MPGSDASNNEWILEKIRKIGARSVLDVGAGNGGLGHRIKHFFGDSIVIDGLEVWEPYISKFSLLEKYNNIFLGDARDWDNYEHDLVVFGEVLEHMSEDDAKRLWGKVSKQAKHIIIITIPIIHYPQGPEYGNPYEVHHEEDWNTEKVLDAFPGITDYKEFEITGAYIASFS